MKFRHIETLDGPNPWARLPVLSVTLELNSLADVPSIQWPSRGASLLEMLPSLADHRCHGNRGGFVDLFTQGTDAAHVIEHVTQELQIQSGLCVPLGWTGETPEPGVQQIVVPFEDEQLARACLDAALAACLALATGAEFDMPQALRELRELADRICLGPTTRAMYKAAAARGIPVRRLTDGRMLQLGYGARQRRVNRAETANTSALAKVLSEDKDLTNSLLKAVGVPIPEGRSVDNAADAWEAAVEIGLPVVVKPRGGSQGRGVSAGLTTREAVESAYRLAEEVRGGVLVEKFAPGGEHRLLVVGGELIAAARGDEARIVGDGRQTVAELIESQLNSDPRRGDDAICPLCRIVLDSVVLLMLHQQGYAPESVVPQDAVVVVQRSGNLAIDVTDDVHPDVAARAIEAAAVVGLDVCGLDVMALDIGRPLEEQGGVVVDVNEGPGLQMHLQPAIGKPRPVAEAILNSLFPPGQNGRIPIVGLVGGEESGTASRVLARLLQNVFGTVGATSSEGVYLNGRRIKRQDARDAANAELLLMNPLVEAALFEYAHSGRLSEGLGFDCCDVAVVTGVPSPDGDSGLPQANHARLAHSLVESVSKQGTAVLNAADPLAVSLAERCPGNIIYFAADGAHSILAQHKTRGGRVVFAREESWVLSHADREAAYSFEAIQPLVEFERGTFNVEAALAALAVAWALGVHGPAAHEPQIDAAALRRAVG